MLVAVRSEPRPRARAWLILAAAALATAGLLPMAGARALDGVVDHLVVSEVVTGGASASDELIELYNPTDDALPLEGLELVYVSSTGATVSRRAAWATGAPPLGPGGHLLVANEAGVYAPIADAVYATGMAATGGSVALRIQGASTAIDAVGWGTAASTWREGSNARAPAAGSSIERLPGGALGSTQDTDDNAADFAERPVPEPQNLASPPTPDPDGPSATPSPSTFPSATPGATLTPEPSPTATSSPTPSVAPGPDVVSIAEARAAADGTRVTIEAVALTGSDFHDGGGFVADPTGGIAVLLDEGAFAAGSSLRVTGTVDDRFSQRTLRSTAADVVALGVAPDPQPVSLPTGTVGEGVEGSLVRVAGAITDGPTALTTGTAFDLDDGSGPTRLIVPAAAGIDLGPWSSGATVDLVGVAGQRDSSGSGSEGYRVMPRSAADVVDVRPPASVSPSPSGSVAPTSTPDPSASPAPGTISIAEARAAAKNARIRVRGVVTLGTGTVDEGTAAIQDGSGAIVLRLGDEAGDLAVGQRIDVTGMRSTFGGMETLRVSEPPAQLGTAAEPAPKVLRTGEAGEAHEAMLVVARGALVASARRASSGTVSFEIDDGSGPLRVSMDAALGADDEGLTAGTWVEVRGVLGQETTGSQPLRGYRIWPRTVADVRVIASTTQAATSADSGGSAEDGDDTASDSLAGVGTADLAGLRIGATLVVGPWPELGIAGLLWDGTRLVGVDERSTEIVAGLLNGSRVPVSLELTGLRAIGTETATGAALVALSGEPGSVVASNQPPSPPGSALPEPGAAPTWVALVGELQAGGTELSVDGTIVPVESRCDGAAIPSARQVSVTGVAVADPARLIVPCGGVVPAPVVVRNQAPRGAAAPAPAAEPAMAAADATLEPRRLVVAGLLAGAAVALAGGAVARRWLPEPEPDAADMPTDADAERGPDRADVPPPPRLTLVRVPNEHGP